jgi:hypothetical protein
MEILEKINIATDFSETLGARFISDGDYSAEEFYNTLLKPKFDIVIAKNGYLEINLDNTYGYPSSFISGSFGKLSIDYGVDTVLKHLKFISEDDPLTEENIINEINTPRKKDK